MFRRCSFATNLVTSPEYNPIWCAAMLCHFSQTRNGSVVTHLFLLSNATSSATGGYVVVPERFGQHEDPASSTEEWTRKKPSFVTKSLFNRRSELTCIFLTNNHDFSSLFQLSLMCLIIFSYFGKHVWSYIL